MRQLVTRPLLAGSGALLGVIGFSMLTRTEEFLAMSGVAVGSDPSLLSELKAPSVLLILAGATMLVGSFRKRFADVGLTIGALVYGCYGLARLIGMAIDGLPTGSLLIATVIELVLAAALLGLRLARPVQKQPEMA